MSERSLLLANSYRTMPFRKASSPDFRFANVPRDLFKIFTNGQDVPNFVRFRKNIPIRAEDSDLYPPFTVNVERVGWQWWSAKVAEEAGEPGAPVAIAALIMYRQKHGYNEMRHGSRPRVRDLHLEATSESRWPYPLWTHSPRSRVLAHLHQGRGYFSLNRDAEPAPDLPTALRNLERDYSMVYREDGSAEVARMMGAQSLDVLEQAWAGAIRQPTAVMAARALLHSGVFATAKL